MSDFQLESALEAIFGERPEVTVKRAQQQKAYETAERDEQQFFRKAEVDRITGYSTSTPLSAEPIDAKLREELGLPEAPAQTFTKAAMRVPEARQKFLDSVDKFISVARGGR
jgi:hypothetical protein